MTADLNKKTLRHFYCRDSLWQCFERMSEDFDRGIDDLVNEAMRFFARERGYLPTENEGRPLAVTPPPPVHTPPAVRPSPSNRPTPPPLPPPPGRPTAARPVATSPAPAEAAENAPPLYVIFENKKYLVDKDQFIIGRGSKSSDLAIRDGNISRKHAAVIRRHGAYFIKDLGSTNGIDWNGQRIDNKKIDEGDVFFLCDYPIKFTFR